MSCLVWSGLRDSVSVLFTPQPCIISECGEHKEGDDWGVAPIDGSGDTHPDFPEDSDVDFKDVCAGFFFFTLPEIKLIHFFMAKIQIS